MEYAVPLSDIEEILEVLFLTARKFKDDGRYIRSMPFILRPVGADDLGFLSPTYKKETCFIDILFQAYDEDEIAFYKEIEKEILSFGGRVSWSRKFFASGSEVLANYPRHSEFLSVMKELDPKGMFLNDFTREIFYND